jgi:thioredoxin 1
MGKPSPVEDNNFEQVVLKANRPVLVDFWATWCKPCLMVAPVIDELSKEYDGRIDFVKVDVDKNKQTQSKYQVMGIPTLIIFKNGQPFSHMVGFRGKAELKRNIDEALS